MSYTYPFEKLEVWVLSKELVKDVYSLTNTFPDFERFSLTSQINRSVISIPSNIAEGSSRTSGKDQAHFLQIAYGSSIELLCQLIIAKDLGYISNDNLRNIRFKIEEITNKINSLRNFQLNKTKSNK